MKNKIIAAILTIALICSSAAILSSADDFMLGDVNGDAKITASDARLALRIAATLEKNVTDEQRAAADANMDKRVTAADARMILRWSAKLDVPPVIPTAPTTDESSSETTTQEPTTEKPSTPDVTTEPTTPDVTTKPDDETTTDNIGQVVDDYPKAIDAFFAGKFYMEAVVDEGSEISTIKFATSTNSKGANSVEIVMPMEGMDVSILMANDGKTYMKLTDSKKKKYYANLTELMKLVGSMAGEEFDIDFSYLLDGLSFGVVKDYGKPVLTKETEKGIEYDVYTFGTESSKIAFYAVDGKIKGIKNIYSDGEESYMEIVELSEKIPTNMLTLKGYDENPMQVLSVLSEIMM